MKHLRTGFPPIMLDDSEKRMNAKTVSGRLGNPDYSSTSKANTGRRETPQEVIEEPQADYCINMCYYLETEKECTIDPAKKTDCKREKPS